MIPAHAVEAALAANLAYKSQRSMDNAEKQMRAALEAAAPYIRAEKLSSVVDVLQQHQDAVADNGGRYCICGDWEGPWTGSAFAAHQANALKDSL